MSEEVRGPHGLWGVRVVKKVIATAPAHCHIVRNTLYKDGRGIVSIYGADGNTLADAWLRRDCEEEWGQAAQWLIDLVGAAFGIECAPF